MSRDVVLMPGRRYYAGVGLPWYVPESIVTSGAEDLGFRGITWADRGQGPPLDPRLDGSYSDDWDRWATGVYAGPAKTETLTHAPAWILVGQAETQPVQAASALQPQTALGQVMAIAKVALETSDPARIKETARILRDGGYEQLATVLAGYAAKLLAGVKTSSWWPALILVDVVFWGWVIGRKRASRRVR